MLDMPLRTVFNVEGSVGLTKLHFTRCLLETGLKSSAVLADNMVSVTVNDNYLQLGLGPDSPISHSTTKTRTNPISASFVLCEFLHSHFSPNGTAVDFVF